MKIGSLATLVGAFVRGRYIDRISDVATIQSLQHRWLTRLLRNVSAQSVYYRPLAHQPLESWPILDKAIWMERFDDILSEKDVDNIHAYLIDQSWVAYRAQEAASHP